MLNACTYSRTLIALLFLLIGVYNAMAGVEPYQNQIKGKIKKGDSLIVKDEKFRNPSFDWNEITHQTVKNFIDLKLTYDTPVVLNKPFSFEMQLKVEYYSQPNQAEPLLIDNVLLKVDYSPDSGAVYRSSASHSFQNGHLVKITVEDIVSPELGEAVPAIFELTNKIVINRKYRFRREDSLSATANFTGGETTPNNKNNGIQAMQFTPPTINNHHLVLTWNHIPGAEEYDIEWATVDAGSDKETIIQQMLLNAPVSPQNLDRVFRNNATRITTSENEYDISLVYNADYIAVRMRQVAYTGTLREEDDWDYQLLNGDYLAIDISDKWHEPDLNWEYSASFAEEGTKKEVVSYFDGTLRNRQSVTSSHADNTGIVQENIYDEFGRPVASILPAPIGEANLRYFRDFNMNQNNTASYNFLDVSSTIGVNCEIQPKTLSILSGAAKYYSVNNEFLNASLINKYIPDAGGFPISVMQYVNDNTGRTRLQGGVGPVFQPGYSNSRVSKYYYGKPESWELDRLFGNDVGYANHYFKNMVVDPNGQISISYLNAAGKAIATALTGETKSTIDGLPSKPVEHTQNVLLLRPEQFVFEPTDLVLSARTSYLASVVGQATFNYDIEQLVYTYTGGQTDICSNCFYELTIKVYNDCNETIYNTTQPVQIGSAEADCENTDPYSAFFTVDFDQIGEYYISYELALSKKVIDQYAEEYIAERQAQNDLRTEFDFILDYLNASNFLDCFNECLTCKEALGTSQQFSQAIKGKLQEYQASFLPQEQQLDNWIGGLYTTLLNNCNAIQQNCSLSSCSRYEKQMLEDVSPGGQYSLFGLSPFMVLEAEFNILAINWRTEFPVRAKTHPEYIAEQLNIEGTIISPHDEAFSLEMLISYWKVEWAAKFIKYHPEKCKLDFCNANLSFTNWDERVKEFIVKASDIPNIPGGSSLTYDPNDPDWLLSADPFFTQTGSPGVSLFNGMKNDLEQYSKNVLGLTDPSFNNKGLTKYIEYILYCADPDGTTNSGSGNSWNNCTPVSNCRVTDREWSYYKEYYFQLKEKYYNQARETGACDNKCPVGRPYTLTNTCASPGDFIIELVSLPMDHPCAGLGLQAIKISYTKGKAVKPMEVQLYYPPEYASLGLGTTLQFAVGESEKTLCYYPSNNVVLSSILIKQVECQDQQQLRTLLSDPFCGSMGEDFDITPTGPGLCSPNQVEGRTFRITPKGPACNNKSGYYDVYLARNPGIYYHVGTFPFNTGMWYDDICIPLSITMEYTSYFVCGTVTTMFPCPDPCNPALPFKKSRFPQINYHAGMNGVTPQEYEEEAENLIIGQVETSCESRADQWMEQLEDCLDGYSSTVKDNLKAKLIELCIKGGDIDHPYGSSTTAPGQQSASGYASFQEVMEDILGLSALTMDCNPWVMDAPAPYAPVQQSAEKIIGLTDEDLCDKIDLLQQAHTTEQPLVSFYQYLSGKYGAAMNLSETELNMLLKSCDNCRFILEQDLRLPVFMQVDAVGCVTATQWNAAKAALVSELGVNYNDQHEKFPDVFANFMNHRWGFAMSYWRYQQYEAALVGDPGALLCNQPPFVSIEVDPYACLNAGIAQAAINGRRDYIAYIAEEKRKFRVQYISRCAETEASVRLSAKQQVYHYTLYYYDQAGNLVRTIPPEGVRFLDEDELIKVEQARAYDPSSCDYNGPEEDADKEDVFEAIGEAIGTNANRSIEMWLYQPQPGPNQVLTMNLDGASRQLFQACLNGNLLGIDIYTFDLGASLAINKSNHITVNLAGVLPLKPWTHLVVQANHMAQGALSVYVNGVLLPAVTGNPPAGCGWELSGVNPVLPENTTTLKHVRIYNRLMTGQEIAANALVDCFSIAEAYRPTLTPSLWARFNTPEPGDPTTISGAGSFETQHAPVYPHHRLASSYAYNSANQAVRQKTPDGGLSHFWYDKISRLIASQNEEQRAPANPLDDDGRYSYTKYDALGRIIEVGEKSGYTTGLPAPGFLSQSEITDFYTDVNATNTQLTQTIYDIVPPPVSGLTPNFTGSHLRKRVSATYYREQEGGAVSQASFYGYDIAGNVKNLWQHVQGIGFKSLQYEYDLASGKVNFISYQDGANDRFYYQYKYDRDIRLVEALTGTEADILPQGSELLNEKTNVTYQYYLHGPLARMELGHDKVQGVDYAYTLQGWLKGINGHRLNAAQEMGNDGVANTDRATIARDVMAYTLGYYQGDYQPIGAGSATAFPMQFTTQPADITGHDLFNGNISHTTVALSKFRNGDPVGYSYRYDQLNRLKQMRRHGLAANTTTWNSSSISDKFKEGIVYDGNGNIKTYLRNGAGETGMPLAMDNLTYVYNTAIDPVSSNPYLVNNRLTQVTDQVANGNYSEDLDGQLANNYHYDKIGNLVKDVKENIDRIEWTVYGKIKKITKGNGDIIAYTYDAAGNRASKSVTESSQTTTTWYVRDAQGNSLALYSDKQGGQSGMWWKEQSLYGSSRLGVWAPEINISSVNGTSQWNVAGKTVYELSNHLGNVLATITDKKIAHDPGNGIYYNAEVVSATDYYPFGMQMPGRNWSSSTYRYGFNGKENDNEVKGEGNQIVFEARMYDPRLGRFFSTDPKKDEYPWQSTYAYHRNNFIAWIDYMGGGDPPTVENGVYFVKLKNPTAEIVYNRDLSSFTHMMKGQYDNSTTTDYTVNLQQYKTGSVFSFFRALRTTWGGNDFITLGQNVQNGVVTGEETDSKRGYLSQDKDGKWQGGLGNPPAGSAVGFGGGIPIIVGGQKYSSMANDEYLEAEGYGSQNSTTVGKVVVGLNSKNNSMMLVVSPDKLKTGGMTLDAIRDKLADQGYDYVFGFDGGSSSTLIQDGNKKLVSPIWYKDNTIPSGVTLTEK